MVQEAFADAVIVAAGSSSRMGGIDKLDADVAGMSVLRRSIEALRSAPVVADVIVVTTDARRPALESAAWLPQRTRAVSGGARRQDSVAAGVAAATADVVLVHDAARPLVSADLVGRVATAARRDGAAIPILAVVDALKRVEGERVIGSTARSGLYRAQTPQGARRVLLERALHDHATDHETAADEAEVLGRAGIAVTTVAGDVANLKITLPEDLSMARHLVAGTLQRRSAVGIDSHPFGTRSGLRLGGLVIEDAPRLHGHSDGDAALHAVCDALLGAAGAGDLGRLFPSGQTATRGIDSAELVSVAVATARDAGATPVSADLTITAARPRLGERRLDEMAERIAELLGLESSRISVKAASGNLGGDEGAGRVISATCLIEVEIR